MQTTSKQPYKALILSAYHARSHEYWCQQLQTLFPEIAWTVLSLPPRHFNWRIRGNSLSWGLGEKELLNQTYDFIIATSMVDLSSLRGFVPALAKIPTVLYFHENQFAYPKNAQSKPSLEAQIVPLYGALCADKVVFNSRFNQQSFLQGANALLKKLPDYVPDGAFTKLADSEVLPVPMASPTPPGTKLLTDSRQNLLELVWNHRWEYDKGPELLLNICTQITEQQLPIRIHIVGEKFRQSPSEFEQLHPLLNAHHKRLNLSCAQFGYVEKAEDYHQLLWECDVVLSTALHDFQGLSVQEAMIRGCAPLVPDDLVYPEYIGKQERYSVSGNIDAQAGAVVKQLAKWQYQKQLGETLPVYQLDEYQQATLRPAYEHLITALTS